MLCQDEQHRYMVADDRETVECPSCGTSFKRRDAPDGAEVRSDFACPTCWQGFIETPKVHFKEGFARCPCGATTPAYELPIDFRCGFCGARFLMDQLPSWRIDESGDVVPVDKPEEQAVADGAYVPRADDRRVDGRDVRCRSCGRVVYSEDKGFRAHPKVIAMAVRGCFRGIHEVESVDCPHCGGREAVNEKQKEVAKEISDLVYRITELAHRAGLALDIAADTKDESRSVDGINDAKTAIASAYKHVKLLEASDDPRVKAFATQSKDVLKQSFVKINALAREVSGA